MNREIKFRAWDKKEKRMFNIVGPAYYDCEYQDFNFKLDFDDEDLRYRIDSDNWELMQFTGLHDKNGKPIYEGDVIQVSTRDKGWRGVVEINERGVRLNDTDLWRYSINVIEVIGNVYENPKLLTN